MQGKKKSELPLPTLHSLPPSEVRFQPGKPSAALYFSPDITRMVISLGSNTGGSLLFHKPPRLSTLQPGYFQFCAVQQVLVDGLALCQAHRAWPGDTEAHDRVPDLRACRPPVGRQGDVVRAPFCPPCAAGIDGWPCAKYSMCILSSILSSRCYEQLHTR